LPHLEKPMGDDSDRMAQALRERDPAVWAETYDRHARDLFTFLAHLVHGDRPLAEELHQETWLAALAGIEGFDSERGDLRAWLFGIARRRAALHFRRSQRDMGPLGNENDRRSAELVDGESMLPIDVLRQIERADAVRAALAELGAEARQALVGKYVEGCSVNELASRLQCSPKAAESVLSRARARMRGLLAWYFDHEPTVKGRDQ
jgi:RNA polymerase sigma-70 factor (ECF subfamily)